MKETCLLLFFIAPLVTTVGHASATEADKDSIDGQEEQRGMPRLEGDVVWIETWIRGLQRTKLAHKTFSLDGKLYAGFYQDGWDETISIHDAATGKQLQRIVGHGDFVERFKFSADGKMLATWSEKGWKIWEVSTGHQLLELPGIER